MKKRASNDTQITLGDGWRQFAAMARPDLEYLGVIRRGMQIGALAKDEAGAYWQVNGDMRQALNLSRVEAKLRGAIVRRPRVEVVRQPSPDERAAVVVVVKPKRRVLMPH
ncbi:MAG: hypothetical protein KGL90_11275 [Burkholderiales bacterium]|nr:hypothetical protein [Burkholderiales bacterium]